MAGEMLIAVARTLGQTRSVHGATPSRGRRHPRARPDARRAPPEPRGPRVRGGAGATVQPRAQALLDARKERHQRFVAGVLPDFPPETAAIRDAAWTVAPPPTDLLDRRVEITGPAERKMVINALN